MSRIFTDRNLLTWEVFASTGAFGLPERPKIVFNCLSQSDRRARFVIADGDRADAEGSLAAMPDDALRALLERSRQID